MYLSIGDRGDSVRKLQQSLMDAGYDVGSTGADGIYGQRTQDAVRRYQQAQGIDADGIFGEWTQGRLYGSSGSQQQEAPKAPSYKYDPSGDQQYQDALKRLQTAEGTKAPEYQGTYDQQLKDLYDKIINRKDFSYDVNSDALYNQYKDQYVTLGKQAMQDTMGQAAALTGGYGSTYGEQVGQQAYNAYLQKLNDIVPQLQQQAYQRYQDEGTDLYNQYSLVKGREDTDYGRYRDTVSDYYSDLSDARSAYNSERSLDQSQWETMLSYWAQKANNENAAYLQALAAEQAAAKKSGGGGGGGKTSSSGLTDKKNETLAKAAKAYMDKMSSATLKNSKDGVRGTGRTVYLDSRTLDNYLNSKGYNALEANTFKAYLEYYGATYQRQR